MKNYILILCMSLCFASGAQLTKESDFLNPFRKSDIPRHDIIMFDLTWNGWIVPEAPNNWNSFGVNAFYYFDIPFGKENPWGIGIGLGYSLFQTNHRGELVRETDNATGESYSTFTPLNDSISFKKNKFAMHSAVLPIELRFRSKKRQGFKLYFGVNIGYNFLVNNSYKDDNITTKTEYRADVNPLKFGPHLRIGNKDVFLSLFYYPTSLFTNNKSTKAQSFQVAISFGA